MKTFWISRNSDGSYLVHSKEPCKRGRNPFTSGSCYTNNIEIWLCTDMVEKMTGIKLGPGKYAKFTLKQVGDVYYYE